MNEILKSAFSLDAFVHKKMKVSVLSNEGKILSFLLEGNPVIFKDIPNATGVSYRSVYNFLGKLQSLGIIEKHINIEDKRSTLIKINKQKLQQLLAETKFVKHLVYP